MPASSGSSNSCWYDVTSPVRSGFQTTPAGPPCATATHVSPSSSPPVLKAGYTESHPSSREVSSDSSTPEAVYLGTSRMQTSTTSAWKPASSFVSASSPLPNAAPCTVTSGYSSSKGSITSGISESSNANTRRVPDGSAVAPDESVPPVVEIGAGSSEHATPIIASASAAATTPILHHERRCISMPISFLGRLEVTIGGEPCVVVLRQLQRDRGLQPSGIVQPQLGDQLRIEPVDRALIRHDIGVRLCVEGLGCRRHVVVHGRVGGVPVLSLCRPSHAP